jgi:hypothetical protein
MPEPTLEKTIIWPNGMRSKIGVEAMFDTCMRVYKSKSVTLRAPSALATMGSIEMKGKRNWMPSFADSVLLRAGRCYNMAAYVAISAQLLGIPTAAAVSREGLRGSGGQNRHGYNLCYSNGELVISDPSLEIAYPLDDTAESQWGFELKPLVQQYPDPIHHDGVIQVRSSEDEGIDPAFFVNEATLEPIAGHIDSVDTIFVGPSGLQMFLNFIERRSALTQNRPPNLNPRFITPRI